MNLKTLQKKWYRKLQQVGFKDIENSKGLLKVWSGAPLDENLPAITSKTGYSSKIFKESQQEYYRLAGQYYYDKEFKSSRDKEIWRLHALGSSLIDIAAEMRMSKGSIQYRIERMRKEFYK